MLLRSSRCDIHSRLLSGLQLLLTVDWLLVDVALKTIAQDVIVLDYALLGIYFLQFLMVESILGWVLSVVCQKVLIILQHRAEHPQPALRLANFDVWRCRVHSFLKESTVARGRPLLLFICADRCSLLSMTFDALIVFLQLFQMDTGR